MVRNVGIDHGREEFGCGLRFKKLVFGKVALLLFLCPAAPAALSGSEVLSRLQAFDEAFQSGFTATGCDHEESSEIRSSDRVRPAADRDWTLVMADGLCVLQMKLADAPLSEYRSLAYTPEEIAARGKRATVSVANWTLWAPEYAANIDTLRGFELENDEVKIFSENWLVHIVPPDDISFDLPLVRFLWSMGRGFSKYVHEIASVVELEDGTIKCSGPGVDSGLEPGCWEFVIDPAAGYLVRSAKYYESDRPSPKRADIAITNSGTVSMNGCIVAQSSLWTDISRNVQAQAFTTHTVTREPDYQLLETTKKLVLGPYEGSTRVYDTRMNPPWSRRFGAGETYTAFEHLDIDPLEGLADQEFAAQPAAGKSGDSQGVKSENPQAREHPETKPVVANGQAADIHNVNDTAAKSLSLAQITAISILCIACFAAVIYWRFVIHSRRA